MLNPSILPEHQVLAQEGGFFPGGLFWPAIFLLLWQLSMVLSPLLGAYLGTREVTTTRRRSIWVFLGTAAGCLLSIVFCGLVLHVFDLPKSRSGVGLVIAASSPLVGGVLGYALAWLLRSGSER